MNSSLSWRTSQLLFAVCALLAAVSSTQAFTCQRTTTTSSTTRTTQLEMSSPTQEAPKSSVIYADDSDFQFDPGQGGVRLATESALSMTGKVVQKKNVAEAKPQQFLRYNQVTPASESQVQGTLQQVSGSVVAVGSGKELYKDPGSTSQQVIELAPLQAAQDLANSMRINSDGDMNYVVNVLGGNDMQVLEMMDALALLRQAMGGGKVSLSFNTLTHASFPLERVTMTLVGLPTEASSNGLNGAEKAIAEGRIFFQDGNYFTAVDDEINTDLM